MTLRDLPPAEFARLSALMDEALDRPVHERERWIDALAQREPGAAELLRSLVASASANADGFLETREVIERHLQRDRAAAPSLVGESIGPWRVLRPLGRGGMGRVYLAERADGLYEQRWRSSSCSGLRAAAAARFERERQILAALDHPNIARLLDGGIAADGRPYLVLERVEGEPHRRIATHRGSTCRPRLAPLRAGRAAVAARPPRTWWSTATSSRRTSWSTADGRPKLLDFGIAKLLEADERRGHRPHARRAAAVTPGYATPSRSRRLPVTTTSDVYPLGVLLYELLCGERAFAAGEGRRQRSAGAPTAPADEAERHVDDAGRRRACPPPRLRIRAAAAPSPRGRSRHHRAEGACSKEAAERYANCGRARARTCERSPGAAARASPRDRCGRLPPAQVRGPAPAGGVAARRHCVPRRCWREPAVSLWQAERGARAGGARGARGDEGEGRAGLPARSLPRQLGRAERPAAGAAHDGARAPRPRRAPGGQRAGGRPRKRSTRCRARSPTCITSSGSPTRRHCGSGTVSRRRGARSARTIHASPRR